MPLAEITRPQYERSGSRYASDATDAEWALIEPLMPPRKRLGRPRTTQLRDMFDAVLYMAATGCQWRMPPNDFCISLISTSGVPDMTTPSLFFRTCNTAPLTGE